MEIIEHGKMYYYKQCERCDCKFNYTEKDIKRNIDELTSDYVICPECGYYINIWR